MGVVALKSRHAVFLDRDGVLNKTVWRDGLARPPQTLDEFCLLPGVSQACRMLCEAEFLLVVVTNQPDVARGTQQRHVVEAMHRALLAKLPITDVHVCYHDDRDGCTCRKPLPGMLLAAALRWNLSLEDSVMVGDRCKDIAAGQRAGCATVLVGGTEMTPECLPTHVCRDLSEAAAWILSRSVRR